MAHKVLSRSVFLLICFSLSVLICGVSSSFALPVTEKAGKAFHLGSPVDLDGKEFKVTGEMVALSEKIKMKSGNVQIISPSIFFIIDHSGSMYFDGIAKDKMGNRFTVTDKIIKMLADDPDAYPDVECGISIFAGSLYYDANTDPLVFEELPDSLNSMTNSKGAYIPLFNLQNDYTTKNGSMKGSAILRKYLETETKSDITGYTYIAPKAPMSPDFKQGTNIDIGFRSAVNALKAANTTKDNQYIIFISDGKSTKGGNDYQSGYVMDTDNSDKNLIATTFTIFFKDSSGTHPASLDDMNKNIKGNNFSASNNKLTQLWDFNNSTEDELLQFVKDSIISVIIKKQVWKNLLIDGANGQWNEKDQVFDLPNVIPLTGTTTPFNYKITYEVDTISYKRTVDTVNIDFDITVDHGLAQNDTVFEITHWKRTLGFYDKNDNGLDSIHGAVDEVVIKFSNDTLTAGYEYTEAKVEVRSVIGGDVELFTLKKDGFQKFSLSIKPKTITGSSNKNNGTLEYKLHDTFIATFRNSENPILPLDTLTTEILINSDILEMTKAIYFDNNADGEIDSVFVEISGECDFTDADITLIAKSITLPDEREFTITKSVGLDNGIGILVTQKSDINTAVTDKDKLEIKETIVLADNGTINKGTVSIIDSMSAVIMKAALVDYLDGSGDDILSINFSESIKEPKKEQPFSFYSIKENKVYSAKLKFRNKNNDKYDFDVLSVEGVSFIEQGDSIRISWKYDNNIVDKVGNNQDNPKNIRREIEVKAITKIIRTTYYDDDANGHVDRMTVVLPEYDYSDKAIKTIVENISFPEYRKMSLDKYEEKNSVITLSVSDVINKTSNSDVCHTSCNSDDKLIIKNEIHLGGNYYLNPCSIDIVDSVSAVIMKASLVDYLDGSSEDILSITFSENIDEPKKEKPFSYYSIKDDKVYSAKLKFRNQNNEKCEFDIVSVSGVSFITDGDSIRINWKEGSNIIDKVKNNQENSKNIRREIDVKVITSIIRSAYYDDDANGHVDRMTVTLPKYSYSDKVIKTIVKNISFAKYRQMVLDKHKEKNSVITLSVHDNANKTSKTDVCHTSCTNEDKLVIKNKIDLLDNFYLNPCSVDIIDSVAPVIMKAFLIDSLRPGSDDELEVVFSESVGKISKEKPFELYSINNKKIYIAKLKWQNQNNLTAFFEVLSLTENMGKIGIGDSIRILKKGDVFDLRKNVQDNAKNVRRQIEVKRIPMPFDVDIKAVIIDEKGEEFMKIQVIPFDKELQTEFDSLSAIFDIYDPVANVVRHKLRMNFIKKNGLIYLDYDWDLRNRAGRQAGSGTYLALFDIKCYYVEDNGTVTQMNHHIKRKFLGIPK